MTNTETLTFEQRQAIERATEAEHENKRQMIVQQVAKALGEGFSALNDPETHDRNMIVTPDGIRFYMGQGRDGRMSQKFDVSGDYHREKLWDHKPFNATTPSITVSITRKPEAIAADIKRRFMPEFMALVATMRENKARSEASANKRMNYTRRLATVAGGAFQIDRENPHTISTDKTPQEIPRLSVSHQVKGYGHIDVSSDGECRIELSSIPFEVAETIVKLFAEQTGDME